MSDVTLIIPVAPYHTELIDRAAASANAQTVPCEVFVYEDTEMRGAGFARNKALREVVTPFVCFLDADDTIEPTFLERCLSVWKPGHYVYTDFIVETGAIRSSDAPWQPTNGEWHVLTSLLRTEDVRKVGGFDEQVIGGEDTLFYWALTRAGICGIALHEPLFTYGKEGRRAKAFVESEFYAPTMQSLITKYGDAMCCGGENPIKSFVPDQVGDVEAYAMWGGNRRELGIITGRLYPRSGNMKVMSVDPRDVAASPEKWQRVPPPLPATPPDPPREVVRTFMPPAPNRVLNGVEELVEARYGIKTNTVLTAQELRQSLPLPPQMGVREMTADELKAMVKPDVAAVRRLAKRKGKRL